MGSSLDVVLGGAPLQLWTGASLELGRMSPLEFSQGIWNSSWDMIVSPVAFAMWGASGQGVFSTFALSLRIHEGSCSSSHDDFILWKEKEEKKRKSIPTSQIIPFKELS